MPKGPKGEKRPADVIGAVEVMQIATGERQEEYEAKPALGKQAHQRSVPLVLAQAGTQGSLPDVARLDPRFRGDERRTGFGDLIRLLPDRR